MQTIRLDFTPEQLAELRIMVLEELHQTAEALAGEAHQAHECGGKVIGQDARSSYHRLVGAAGLLDVIGWSVDGNLELVLAAEQKRRVA